MGYHSDIYIKCKKEKALEFKAFLDTYKKEFNTDLRQEEEFATDDNYIYLTISDWKFYTSYPEVQAIIDFVENEDMDTHIGMIAIGEDGAADSWGTPYEVDLYTNTNIEGMI